MKNYYVYLMTNKYRNVLYRGVTNDLQRRMYEHKSKLTQGFTTKYNVDILVYCEDTSEIEAVIAREKQIKGWTRKKKNQLIESINPLWADLNIIAGDPSAWPQDDRIYETL